MTTSLKPSKTVLIIGAGVAGLAAGCYAQMNGLRSKIFELHDLPGGLCTAWERKGYIFDGCIHYLFGSGEGQPFNELWKELGVLPGRAMIDHAEFMRVSDSRGKTLVTYADPEHLAQHIAELSPADAHLGKELADGVRTFCNFDMSILQQKPKALMTAQDWRDFGMKMTPYLLPLAKWGLVEAQDYAKRFKDPFLQRAWRHVFGWAEIPMMAALSVLAYMHTRNAGFPSGGSLELARDIERRYLALGGEIYYKGQVEKILVEDGRAVGVRLYNDEVHRGDYVISAADGRGTLFDLLDEEHVPGKMKELYDGRLPLHSMLQVSYGVDRDLSAEPHWATYLLDEPLLIAGEAYREIGVKHYCFDPSLASPGKSCLVVMLRTPYSYWQRIYGRRLYDTEQSQVADILLEFLEGLYPGIRSQVEVSDVATPLSYERYTGNWQGSSCGWLLTQKTMTMMIQGMPKTLPKVENFYMAGQWVEPGGSVPICAMSGRNAIQLICAAEGSPFIAKQG